MMASPSDSSLQFFQRATPIQWSYVLSNYKEVLKLKAHATRGNKKNGPEELIKLDTWYQETLPKVIHSRKEAHVTHEELVQITKWKLYRGKNRSRILDLVRINTELAVATTTKKAFKKANKDLSGAINALTNLKGIGPATASAILAAGYPECCPYMADESMLSTPGVEATDYTLAEFSNYSDQIKKCTDRLNELDPESKWTPHKVELALWTHYVTKELKPNLLDSMPPPDGTTASTTTDSTTNVAVETPSGKVGIQNEESRSGSEDVESSEEEQRSPQDLSTSIPTTNGTKAEIGSDDSEESKSPVVTDEDRVVKVDSSSGTTMVVNEESSGIEERLSSTSAPEPEQECSLDLRSNGVKRRLEEEDESIGSIPSAASGDGDLSRGSNTNESNSIDGNNIIGNKVTSSTTTNGNGHTNDDTKNIISSSFPSSFLNPTTESNNSIVKKSNPDEMVVDSSVEQVVSNNEQNGMNLKRIKTSSDEVTCPPIQGGLS